MIGEVNILDVPAVSVRQRAQTPRKDFSQNKSDLPSWLSSSIGSQNFVSQRSLSQDWVEKNDEKVKCEMVSLMESEMNTVKATVFPVDIEAEKIVEV